jgi:predicted amidohydrolase
MTTLTVAAAQIACLPGDLQANLASHLAMIETARRRGVDLLVFPELSLTDYLAAPDCAALAMMRDEAALTLIAKMAGPMTVSVGFIERARDGRVFNAQALLAGGEVLAVHRKLNLPGYGCLREDEVYAAGDALDAVPLAGGWRVATLICADSWNPALPWLAALSGANLLLQPVASSLGAVGGDFDNPRGWEINLSHTALTYGLPIVFANHCGARGDAAFWGGSRILDATGRELARAGAEPGLVVAGIDLADGLAARKTLPTIRDSAPDLIQRLLVRQLSRSPDPESS